jgi:hypothetical protein
MEWITRAHVLIDHRNIEHQFRAYDALYNYFKRQSTR